MHPARVEPATHSDGTARFDVLLTGSLTSTGGKVVSTCSLVRDDDRVIVVDPGMADGPGDILRPLAAFGLDPTDVTDVVLSHHHPDHTMYAGLFTRAAVHDFWAIYRGSQWEDSDAEGRRLSRNVSLIRVPGHTMEDIALIAETADGTVVCTHCWFSATIPIEDPTAEDAKQLHGSRARILEIADIIVPGHGPLFRPDETTPR
jgi:glyoxylase-like metal-dependent hydrolase (beta-lactamase superfamily II)